MEKKIYLIRGNDGRYKIGISKHPNKRIKELQTGNSDKLVIIDSYESPNAHKIESALHRFYSYYRKEGEWFDLSVLEESKFIENCQRIDNTIKILQNLENPYV